MHQSSRHARWVRRARQGDGAGGGGKKTTRWRMEGGRRLGAGESRARVVRRVLLNDSFLI